MEKTTVSQMIKNIINNPNLIGSIIPMQIFGAWALFNIFTGGAPTWWWLAVIVGYVAIMMLGVSGCYHRLLSHKGFEVSRPMKILMLWFGVLGGQGSPVWWVALHRGYHHRHTDKDEDPHSPVHGLLHAYITWMFKIPTKTLNPKFIVDLLRDKDVVFFHTHYFKVLWISNALLALISIDLWLYTMLLPAFITLHSFSIQTCFNHLQSMGYKNYQQDNHSVNSVWLFPLILGEAWHNNHHGDAKNADYGSRRWWEIDPTYWIIKLIRKS
jgi:stearoyl-CoA desaturase (delta-9 desaturase)